MYSNEISTKVFSFLDGVPVRSVPLTQHLVKPPLAAERCLLFLFVYKICMPTDRPFAVVFLSPVSFSGYVSDQPPRT